MEEVYYTGSDLKKKGVGTLGSELELNLKLQKYPVVSFYTHLIGLNLNRAAILK